MATGPSSWFGSTRLAADGWWEPFSENVGDSASNNPSGDGDDSPVVTPFFAKDDSINQFIPKLCKLLDDPASASFVSWAPDGRSFMVHALTEFTDNVLPTHFKHSSYTRLIIDLSAYGFRFRFVDNKLTEFAREGFVRGSSRLLQKGFGFNLKDIDQTGCAKMGFGTEQSHPLQKVHTPIPLQSPPPCPPVELEVKEEMECCHPVCRVFHTKVYFMVDDPATDHIVSWGPSGRSFIVRNPLKLCMDLLPKYFGHEDFYGFVMLLCLNGFRFRSLFRSVGDLKQFEFAKEGFDRRRKRQISMVHGQEAVQSPCLKKVKIEEDTTDDRVEIKRKMAELEERLDDMPIQSSTRVPCGKLERQTIMDMDMRKEMEELKQQVEEMEGQSLDEMKIVGVLDGVLDAVLEDLREIKQQCGEIKENMKEDRKSRDAFMLDVSEKIGILKRLIINQGIK